MIVGAGVLIFATALVLLAGRMGDIARLVQAVLRATVALKKHKALSEASCYIQLPCNLKPAGDETGIICIEKLDMPSSKLAASESISQTFPVERSKDMRTEEEKQNVISWANHVMDMVREERKRLVEPRHTHLPPSS
ncbi:hypothetical protein BDZ89DRAFT_1173883 [Hymenopellis radicata]|nr:hypothetical protein BDZ89DRAFT_1173883 [Hymenopellis radicata]